nr:MAG TPA: hypothetical protein [Caudoviricetes sp.]
MKQVSNICESGRSYIQSLLQIINWKKNLGKLALDIVYQALKQHWKSGVRLMKHVFGLLNVRTLMQKWEKSFLFMGQQKKKYLN